MSDIRPFMNAIQSNPNINSILNEIESPVMIPVDYIINSNTNINSNGEDLTSIVNTKGYIHGSSLIQTIDNKLKPISSIRPGNIIMGGDAVPVKVILLNPFRSTYNYRNGSNCIVFEIDSLEKGVPFKRFITDPGHLIATVSMYNQTKELKVARSYVNGKTIYVTKWDKIRNLLPSVTTSYQRYNLQLEQGTNTFIANGIVVQSI